jgi:VIT1/CCC1 family predicted Fe2+/Mn2+ transporter
MVGAGLADRVIVIAGAINAIAGVLSMSMGTYLSSKAERDVAASLNGGAPPPDARSPLRDAAVMAAAYALGAVVPLLPFTIGVLSRSVAVALAVVLTGVALFLLGVGKAAVSHQQRVRSGVEMLLLASAAGVAGYLLGVVARSVFGLEV